MIQNIIVKCLSEYKVHKHVDYYNLKKGTDFEELHPFYTLHQYHSMLSLASKYIIRFGNGQMLNKFLRCLSSDYNIPSMLISVSIFELLYEGMRTQRMKRNR